MTSRSGAVVRDVSALSSFHLRGGWSLVSTAGHQRRLRPLELSLKRLIRRSFHDYFLARSPGSSMHPDARSSTALAARFAKESGTAHPEEKGTTLRIKLKSAKHHYGVAVSRGGRPYNEDTHQAGVIQLPSFAKRLPRSIRLSENKSNEAESAAGVGGDPQTFLFSVMDGHGGTVCSAFLRDNLAKYIEESSASLSLQSSLKEEAGQLSREDADRIKAMEKELVMGWKNLAGGYWRRAKPAHLSIYDTDAGGMKKVSSGVSGTTIEEVLTYAFLKADYDFVSAQANKRDPESDSAAAERPLNEGDMLGSPNRLASHVTVDTFGGPERFKGGSTCSIALISTPTFRPFWDPSTTASLLTSHVGDTRIILSNTATGQAYPLTTNHHPSSPVEAARLRRYSASFITDSFGEERVLGLANTRAFGDISVKRVGVSAEPEMVRVDIKPAEYAFMVIVSDGVTASLNDQEIVDIVKEAKTPDAASLKLVQFAVEVGGSEADNATAQVVRLGGWERRQEGGEGSLGTQEERRYKAEQAADPRSSRR